MARHTRGLLVTCPKGRNEKGCGATFRYHGKIHREIRCACGHRFYADPYLSLREDRLKYVLNNFVTTVGRYRAVVVEYGVAATASSLGALVREGRSP